MDNRERRRKKKKRGKTNAIERAFDDRASGSNEARARNGGRMQARAEIVPIRFDVEVDGKFLKDAFCWNAKESQEAVEEFVVGLIKDARLPQSFVAVMVDSMQRQINEFRMVEEKAKARALQETERLEVIKITLRCGTTSIQDSFVWDIFSKSEDDPELFARTLCRDLDLDERELAPPDRPQNQGGGLQQEEGALRTDPDPKVGRKGKEEGRAACRQIRPAAPLQARTRWRGWGYPAPERPALL